MQLSVELYVATRALKDFGFRDQLARSRLPIPSNIAEGYERDSDADIAQFLKVAKGSAGELRPQNLIGIQAEILLPGPATAWADEAKQLGAMLASLIRRHKSKKSP